MKPPHAGDWLDLGGGASGPVELGWERYVANANEVVIKHQLRNFPDTGSVSVYVMELLIRVQLTMESTVGSTAAILAVTSSNYSLHINPTTTPSYSQHPSA